MILTFFKLIIGHAFADFALQNDYVAQHKDRRYGYGDQGNYNPVWFWVLGAHALMHGGVVWAITGRADLALLETVWHAGIDFMKCEKWIGYHTDQSLHLLCKVVWCLL